MRTAPGWLIVLIAVTLLSPAIVLAGQHSQAKIISHADPIHAKCLPCVCTTALGVSEVSFGIDYDGTANSGVDDVVWYQCLDTAYPSAAPDPVWPEAGSWIRIIFDDCQGTVANPEDPEGDGSVVLGGYALHAATDDVFSVVPAPDPDHPGEFRVRVVDCAGEVTELDPERLVRLGFGSADGYDPCEGPVPAEPSTWSLIKQLYPC